jgi:hypothetical protein
LVVLGFAFRSDSFVLRALPSTKRCIQVRPPVSFVVLLLSFFLLFAFPSTTLFWTPLDHLLAYSSPCSRSSCHYYFGSLFFLCEVFE